MQQTSNLCEFGLIATMIESSDAIFGIMVVVVLDEPIPIETVNSFCTVDLLLLHHS